ncbi:MAG: S1C family serine protease, partial [Vicinamibacterales bacterium]
MARRRFVAHLLLATLLVSSSVHAQDDASPRASGTAFAVHATGKLLTNSHVIEGCTEITVVRPGGMPTRGRVQAADGRNDLALIAIDSPLTSLATFRRSPIRAGEDVIALGFPLHGLLAASLNVSRGIVSATAGLLNDTAQLQFSAGVQPGNSGGPLLDASGQVAGIVVAKLDALVVARAIGDIPQNVNFAIKTEVAEMFLRTHG